MINWKRITKGNFTEFLSDGCLEEIKENGFITGETYYTGYEGYENCKYVFLSDEKCIVTECSISFDINDVPDCREFKAECLYHNLTHFALLSEYEAILPKESKE